MLNQFQLNPQPEQDRYTTYRSDAKCLFDANRWPTAEQAAQILGWLRRARAFTCLLMSAALCLVLSASPVSAMSALAPSGTGATGVLAAVATASSASACPFCSAINMTFWEQIKSHDAVVIARLITLPPPVAEIDAELPKAEFEVVRVLRGSEHIEPEAMFRVLLVGDYPVGQEFVVMGVNPPGFVWSTPLKATPRVVEYVESLGKLPEKGAERLAFFQKYFEDEESVLAFDAYDEFARAPYEDVLALKDRMNHDQLVKWILNPETSVNRRRLYFTMLSVCGGAQDLEMLERLIRSDDRKEQAGLDALVSCYLKLKGPDGLELIEREFLKNEEADYVDTLATISALRFHGSEEKTIPRERLVAAVRTLLDRPKMADMIIPDLARWEDWTVMEKLVELFKNSTEDTVWVRVPVIQYLQVCPRPEAKKHIEELRKIDPDAVARAALFNEIDLDEDDDSEKADPSTTEEPAKKPADPAAGSGGGTTGGGTTGGGGEEAAQPEQIPQTVRRVPFPPELPMVAPPEQSASGLAAAFVAAKPAQPAASIRSGDLNEPSLVTNVEQVKPDSLPPSMVAEIPGETLTSLLPTAPLAPAIPVDIGLVDLPGVDKLPVAGAVTPGLPSRFWGLRAIALPLACGCLLFAVLWSVINGWFERLIF
ncbi:MAG: hypothetical protein ACK56J_09545 [Planctomycetota bacterium]